MSDLSGEVAVAGCASRLPCLRRDPCLPKEKRVRWEERGEVRSGLVSGGESFTLVCRLNPAPNLHRKRATS